MKKTKRRPNSRSKNKKKRVKFAPRKNNVRFFSSLRCYQEPAARQILRQLINHFPLRVKIWKGDRLIEKFGPSNNRSKQVDIEFFPATPLNHSYWYLRGGKSQNPKGCLLSLMAAETNTSPAILKDVICYGKSIYASYGRLHPLNAAHWLRNSQGHLAYIRSGADQDLDKVIAYPRKNASDPCGMYRHSYRGSVEVLSSKEGGPIPGFMSFGQQDMLLQLADKHVLSCSEQLHHFMLDTYERDFETFFMTIEDLRVPPGLHPVKAGVWQNGEKVREFVIDKLSLTLSYRRSLRFDPRKFGRRQLMIHEFFPLLRSDACRAPRKK